MTDLPAGWRSAPLGEVCTVVGGGTPKTGTPEFWGGEIPWITPADMSADRSQVLSGGARTLTAAGLAASAARVVPAGSVVVSSRAPVGYVAIAGAELATNQGCKTAVPPESIDSRYLYWYLLAARPDLEARASGTTFKEISAKEFGRTLLRWPSLDDQRRIVEILEDHLSRLDAANDYLDALARRLRSLEVAVLRETVESTAERVHLRDLVARVEAGRSFGGAAPPARPDEWGVIKVSAMTWGEFQAGENKAVPADRIDARFEIAPGDLLVSRANTSAYVGASVLVRETRPQLLLSDKSLRLVPQPGVDTEWLQLALSAPGSRAQISSRATGTKDSMRNISQASLLSIEVPQALFDEQRAQVSRVRAVQSAIRALALAATEADARAKSLRRGLLSAAFSGRLTGRSSDLDLAEEMAHA